VRWVNCRGKTEQFLAPAFRARFDAELYAEVYPTSNIGSDPQSECALAHAVEAFVTAWDESHEDAHGCFPTPDGRYPSAAFLAKEYKGRAPLPISG